MEIEMKIKGLVLDPLSQMPIVVLEDPKSGRLLPIWIGDFEANAIALTIENIPSPRPMTHDLMKSLLVRLGISVDRIVVTDVRNKTFFASIHCRLGDRLLVVDARPSDAIALALRMASPIFVEAEVVEATRGFALDENGESAELLRKWLETLGPGELGKYKM